MSGMNFALGFKPAMGDASEKQLICHICLEIFHKPVVILQCQHNLCRKCGNYVFQASNPLWQNRGSTTVSTEGLFRCPSCCHEVVLDRHGVHGLQRNLLLENIIDIYKPESSRDAIAFLVAGNDRVQALITQMEDICRTVKSAKDVFKMITDTAKASNIERTEAGYESMAHFIIHTENVADMLRAIDFQTGDDLEDSGEEGLEDLTSPSAHPSGESDRL